MVRHDLDVILVGANGQVRGAGKRVFCRSAVGNKDFSGWIIELHKRPLFLLIERGQAGSGHGLTNSAAGLVGKMQFYARGEFGEFLFKDRPRPAQNNGAAVSGGHPAKDQHMAQVVVIRVVSNAVTNIAANRLKNLCARGSPECKRCCTYFSFSAAPNDGSK